MLSIPGKLLSRVVTGDKRIIDLTEWRMGEEQCGFQKGRGHMDQVFAMKQVMEKYFEKNKYI